MPARCGSLTPKPVKKHDLNGNLFAVIDQVLAGLHADMQVLERTKAILSRG